MIKLDNLCFAYPGRKALFRDLSLHITQGENILLTGENGCGKSTLLKLIMGILSPQAGSIKINGKAFTHLQAEMFRDIFYHSQNTAENLLGISPEQDWDLWRISMPDLPPLKDCTLFTELSSGQQKQHSQRILPFLMDKYWLLDEPFTSLDNQAQSNLRKLLEIKMLKHPGTLIIAHELHPDSLPFSKVLSLHEGILTRD